MKRTTHALLRIAAFAGLSVALSSCGSDPVEPVAVGSVTLSHQTAIIVPGSTLTLVATVRDTAGATLSRSVSWSTSDGSRASVSPSGVVSGVAAGSVTITATSEAHSAQTQLTVKEGGVIGAAGGSFTALGGRVELIVPQGALTSSVMITVEAATSPPSDGRLLSGSAIELGPTGQTFSMPVQLRMRYELNQLPPGAAEQQLRIHRADGVSWQLVSGTQSANSGTRTVTASLTSFSQYALLSARPDLVLDVMTAPVSGEIGKTIPVLTTVRNAGTEVAGSFRLGFYYSTDATITSADSFSGFACDYAAGLAVNTMSDCAGSIPVPAGLTPGTYYVGAIADDLSQILEISESNNARAASNATAVVVLPDLSLDVVTAPPTGATGSTILVLAAVRNAATAATGVFRVGFYYSTDATITTSDRFSGAACTYASGLPANSFSNCTGTIPVPQSLEPGTYFVGAIVDDNLQVTESNEGNNSRAAATTTAISNLPDFVVDVVTAASLGLIDGNISMTATVRNQGSATPASFRVGIYYSTDATITTSDIYSGFACTYASGLAANSQSDCNGPIPVPGPAGTYFVGAIADDNAQIAEANESNNARAATSTTVVSAAPPPLNLFVDAMYLTQATQNYAGNVPLVAGRDAFLRVFVRATAANNAAPDVRVRFYQGGVLIDTRTLPASSPQVNTTTNEGVLVSSWNTPVAGAMMQPGLAVLADIDPANTIVETDEADNAFPVSGVAAPADVRTMPAFNVTLVPIMQSANGLTGNVSVANQSTFLNFTTKLWPVSAVSPLIHDVFTTNLPVLQSDDANHSWINLLNELNAVRVMEGTGRHYYGVMKVSYSQGVAGLGFIGLPASIGWDFLPSGDEVAAHEFGHNFGRFHSPCGGPSDIEPLYPYANGIIGVYGYDNATGVLKSPGVADIMSYCSPPWISDFTYKAAFDFIASHPTAPIMSQPVASVLIWGRIDNGRLVLEPSIDLVARPTPVRASGAYRIEATDAAGRTILSFPFAPDVVADAPSPTRQFAFVIPKSAFAAQEIAMLRLSGPLGLSTSMRATVPANAAAPAAAEPVVRRRGANVVDVTWDSQRYPLAVVRSATTGAVLSIARGGAASVRSGAGEVDVIFSDGVKSVTRRLRVIQ